MEIIKKEHFKAYTRDLIKELKGSKSANSLSLKLGYDDNRVSRWTTGAREPSLLEFFDFLEVLFIPYRKICSETLLADPDNLKEFISHMMSQLAVKDLSERLEVSAQTLYRWKKLETLPKLSEFFALVHFSEDSFFEFLYELMSFTKERTTSLKERVEEKLQVKFFFHQHPECSGVLRLVEISAPKSREEATSLFCDVLSIDKELSLKIFDQLLEWNILYLNNEDQRFWVSLEGKMLNTYTKRKSVLNRQKAFWIKTGFQRLEELKNTEQEVFSYLIYSTGPTVQKKIEKKMRDFYREVVKEIQSSSPSQENKETLSQMNVFCLQNFTLYENKEQDSSKTVSENIPY